jgi:hypothetical protein
MNCLQPALGATGNSCEVTNDGVIEQSLSPLVTERPDHRCPYRKPVHNTIAVSLSFNPEPATLLLKRKGRSGRLIKTGVTTNGV